MNALWYMYIMHMYLPDINGRVDAVPHVHDNVSPQHSEVSSQSVRRSLACSQHWSTAGGQERSISRQR